MDVDRKALSPGGHVNNKRECSSVGVRRLVGDLAGSHRGPVHICQAVPGGLRVEPG